MRLWYLQCVKNIMSLQNMSNHFKITLYLDFVPFFDMIKHFQSSFKGII